MVIHPNTKKELEIKNLERIVHTISKNGKDTGVECVEFVVVGKNSEWKDWSTYETFRELNPTIEI